MKSHLFWAPALTSSRYNESKVHDFNGQIMKPTSSVSLSAPMQVLLEICRIRIPLLRFFRGPKINALKQTWRKRLRFPASFIFAVAASTVAYGQDGMVSQPGHSLQLSKT